MSIDNWKLWLVPFAVWSRMKQGVTAPDFITRNQNKLLVVGVLVIAVMALIAVMLERGR